MTTSGKLPDEVMRELDEGCPGSKEYLAQKKRNLANFKKFLENVEGVKDSFENVVDQPEKFENDVKNYFFWHHG